MSLRRRKVELEDERNLSCAGSTVFWDFTQTMIFPLKKPRHFSYI